MSEDAAGHVERTPEPSQQGQWRTFAETNGWTGPADAIRYSLRDIRQQPSIITPLRLTTDAIPPNHKPGEPLPLDVELKALFAYGSIGNEPTSIVTMKEFLTAAPEIWNLQPDDMEQLKEHTLPEVEAWCEVWDAEETEQSNLSIEQENRFILGTWGSERFRVLTEQVLPHVSSPDIGTTLSTFQSLHGNDLVQAFDTAEDALQKDDVQERRSALESSVDRVLGLAARITRLHPDELRKVAETERYQGYLFLDSIAEQWPVLDNTYEEISRQEETLHTHGVHIAEGDEFAALREREEAISELRYGAQDAHSVQDIDSYLRGEGKHVMGPQEPQHEESDLPDPGENTDN